MPVEWAESSNHWWRSNRALPIAGGLEGGGGGVSSDHPRRKFQAKGDVQSTWLINPEMPPLSHPNKTLSAESVSATNQDLTSENNTPREALK